MAKTKRFRNKRYSRGKKNTLKRRRTRKTRCKLNHKISKRKRLRQIKTRQRGGETEQERRERLRLRRVSELEELQAKLDAHKGAAEKRATELQSLREERRKRESSAFIGAIYGQSTKDLPGNNKSLCDAMNEWLDNKGSEFTDHYIILCGPSDEKSEMKMGLSEGGIGDREKETEYYDFEGYPICIYTYRKGDKTYNLIVLCEEAEFREGSERQNFGGSVNTLENMFELFICYAFLKNQFPLKSKTVDDIYHCCGSGMAQVMRACFNVVPTGYGDLDWVCKLNDKWTSLIDRCDDPKKTELMESKKTVLTAIQDAGSPMEYKADGPGSEDKKFMGEMPSQFIGAINAAKRDIGELFLHMEKSKVSPAGFTVANHEFLNSVSNEEFLEYGQKVHEDPNGIARLFLLENLFKTDGDMREVSSILSELSFPESIVRDYQGGKVSVPPRPMCHKATVEFFEWMENWSEWEDKKFISYLDGNGGWILHKETRARVAWKTAMKLYIQRLEIDIMTAKKWGAGFNNGDLMKSIITYLFSPSTPLHYPQSIRTY